MSRRTPRRAVTPRKPEWNTYLTDDARYKLSQQQQLQRQLQQLSAAHFSARSPSAASAASRRRRDAHRSAWSTPRDKPKTLRDVKDTGELKTARKLQFTDVSMEMEDTPRKKGPVSFEEPMDPTHKANLQGELEVLEKMLWELETETERLSLHTPQKKQQLQVEIEERERDTEVDVETQELEEEEEEEGGDREVEERLGDVCYRSLEIGLDLTRKMETLTKELENERRLREDRDLKIEMLEQEVRSTQARCNYLEAKYQGVTTQLDDMREAVVNTEEAIHRMTLAFEYAQRRRAKSSNPTTPVKPAVSRSHPTTATKAAKKVSTPRKPVDQENAAPNQH